MTFIQKAIGQGVAILFGATGEIVTEKSGNLNLGIPGIMYMGGISGLMGAFFYENGKENPNGFVGLLIAFLATLIVSALGGLIYSFLTITLRANQNVVGLALTTFGVGFGNSAVLFQNLPEVSDRFLYRRQRQHSAQKYRDSLQFHLSEIYYFPMDF